MIKRIIAETALKVLNNPAAPDAQSSNKKESTVLCTSSKTVPATMNIPKHIMIPCNLIPL